MVSDTVGTASDTIDGNQHIAEDESEDGGAAETTRDAASFDTLATDKKPSIFKKDRTPHILR